MTEFTHVELWSAIFLTEEAGDGVTCSLDKTSWRGLMNRPEYEGCGRLFARVEHEEIETYLPLGGYTECEEGEIPRLILPQRALDSLFATGTGELAKVTWLTQEAFPEATRIVLRPHDSTFYSSDIKAELEVALTRIGVLQKGHSIKVVIQSLGDYPVEFDVVELEPATIVLAQGDEVAIEFETAVDAQAATLRPDTPIPKSPFEEVVDFSSMISTPATTTVIEGRTLGGTNRYTADGRPWNPHRDA
jgi:hypothetical protein